MTERSEGAADKVGVAAKRTNFFSELRRRNVIRMAGLYLVGAWLITQVAGTLLPTFDAPAWVMKVLVVVLAIGFLAALVFSWLYELTPEGLKRDAEVAPDQSIAATTGKRMDRLLLVGMLAVIGVIAADRFWPREAAEASNASESPTPMPAPAVPIGNEAADEAADPLAKPIVRGIAVLPFGNLSPDPDNAYFAGGIHEEVLTKLSRMSELRIISRTSMERIAEEKLEVSAIGQRLGVSHVLEGSVRRAGDQVRVTVQLIEAATDAHVWAENYDRKLDDVFAIQSEIALAIAEQLKISLSPQLQASLGERPTQNQQAYALYLRALDESRSWRGESGFRTIINLLEPALQLDPDFLAAKVMLANAYGRMYWLTTDPEGSFAAEARELVAEITQRWPDRPEAQLALAQSHYNIDHDYAQALTAFQVVQARLPNEPAVLSGIASSLKRLGRYEEFLAAAQAALATDPEAPVAHSEVLYALLLTLRCDEALAFGAQSTLQFPEDLDLQAWFAEVELLCNQDLDEYLRAGLRDSSYQYARYLHIARFVRGDVDGAVAVLLARVQSATPREAAVVAGSRAELLRLAGRGREADEIARTAYALVRSLMESEKPRADVGAAYWYASAAAVAAQAGEREAAESWREQAIAARPRSIGERFVVAALLSETAGGLGDQDAAWQVLAPFAGDGIYLPDAQLRVFKPYYDQLYGQSASYRAYMAGIAKP